VACCIRRGSNYSTCSVLLWRTIIYSTLYMQASRIIRHDCSLEQFKKRPRGVHLRRYRILHAHVRSSVRRVTCPSGRVDNCSALMWRHRYVLLELSDEVAWREVVADDVGATAAVGERSSDSQMTTVLPDDLREVAAWFGAYIHSQTHEFK